MTQEMTSWEGFSNEVKARESDYKSLLPPDVSKDRFVASALAAVREKPELLQATSRSLFSAVTKAAQDGLLPDGREGVILSFNTKIRYKNQNGNWQDRWENQAAWMPITEGLRKRARTLDGILVGAEVVYYRDLFDLNLGDAPSLVHKPPKLGEKRGPGVGCYAIFRKGDEILHREIMSLEQIEVVRGQSRNKEGLLWKTFWEEAWRKTVIRRGFKSVPVSPALDQIIRRDDDLYDFDNDGTGARAPNQLPAGVRPNAQRERPEAPEVVTGDKPALPEPVEAATPPTDTEEAPIADPPPPAGPRLLLPLQRDEGGLDWRDWGVKMASAINGAESDTEVNEWLKVNAQPLERAQEDNAPVYNRIIEIAELRKAHLEPDEPAMPEVEDGDPDPSSLALTGGDGEQA